MISDAAKSVLNHQITLLDLLLLGTVFVVTFYISTLIRNWLYKRKNREVLP